MSDWRSYTCHKKVRAIKIVNHNHNVAFLEDGTTYIINERMAAALNSVMDDQGAYLVEYEDGYVSVSPVRVFDAGYTAD